MDYPYRVTHVDVDVLTRLIDLIENKQPINEKDYATAFKSGLIARGVIDLLECLQTEELTVSDKCMVLAYLNAILENNVDGVSEFTFDVHADFKVEPEPAVITTHDLPPLWRFG